MNDVAWAAAIIGGVTLFFILLFIGIGTHPLFGDRNNPGCPQMEGQWYIQRYDPLYLAKQYINGWHQCGLPPEGANMTRMVSDAHLMHHLEKQGMDSDEAAYKIEQMRLKFGDAYP